jgi:ATP-dependent DNA helicase RecQ
MEFPHVFILDGDWGRQREKSEWEEERRVMYVGMTRAEETLRLMKIPGRSNPFLKEIRGDCVWPRRYTAPAMEKGSGDIRYEMMGLNEVYMDYAGCFPSDEKIHQWLGRLEAGQSVSFVPHANGVEIHTADGNCVAKLSQEGARKWGQRLHLIDDVRVVALLKRHRDDPQEGFQKRIKTDQWELPVIEVVYVNQMRSICPPPYQTDTELGAQRL